MGLTSEQVLAVGKAYTNLVALGLSSISVSGTTVTFTLNSGETASVTVPTPADGAPGADGKDLEFIWDGTKLGVRVAGSTDYTYSDLKYAQGQIGETTATALLNCFQHVAWKDDQGQACYDALAAALQEEVTTVNGDEVNF